MALSEPSSRCFPSKASPSILALEKTTCSSAEACIAFSTASIACCTCKLDNCLESATVSARHEGDGVSLFDAIQLVSASLRFV